MNKHPPINVLATALLILHCIRNIIVRICKIVVRIRNINIRFSFQR